MMILLGTEENNTFLSVSDGAIRDTGNNSVIPISPDEALVASVLRPDVEPPTLDSITLDLDEGALLLEFSEAVNASGIAQRVTLRNTLTNTAMTSSISPLNDPIVVTEVGSSTVEIQLSDDDLSTLKMPNNFGTNAQDTFIELDITGITDFAGFFLNSTVGGNVVTQSINVTTDNSGPRIISSSLDLNSGLLTLLFDEVALANSITFSAITVVNADTSATIVTLDTRSTTNTTQNARRVDITIPLEDVNLINSAGTDQIDLSIANGFVLDIISNSFSQVTVSPTLTEDLTAPLLLQWSLDMNSGLIQVTFSEAVDAE